MFKKTICAPVGLFAILTACTPTSGIPDNGVWRATYSYDASQSLPTIKRTAGLYEIQVTGGSISGFVYFCSDNFSSCQTNGHAITGSVSSKGVAMLTYTIANPTGGTTKLDITGTFLTKSFDGRFLQVTTGQANLVGPYNMTWYQKLEQASTK